MKVQCARLSVAVSLCVVTAGCGEGVPPETPAGEGEDIGSASAALTGPILGDFEDGTLWLDVESGEDLWQLFSHSSPPVVSMLRRLDDDRREEFHRAFVELFETYREGGRVRAPRRYLLTLGHRR